MDIELSFDELQQAAEMFVRDKLSIGKTFTCCTDDVCFSIKDTNNRNVQYNDVTATVRIDQKRKP